MAISNASRLADFGTGIGTQGAAIQIDNVNQRVGIGTTNPQGTLQVGTGVTIYGNSGIVSATSFYGDGTNITLTNNPTLPTSGVGIATAGGTVGTGVTLLDFRGAGISTVTASAGIATVNITGGGGGGGASVSISTVAPTSPNDGDLWFDNSDGNSYIWYDAQSVWVVSQTYGY